MFKSKKMIAIVGITIMAFSIILSGCNAKTPTDVSGTSATSATSKPAEPTTAAPLKPVNLSWYFFGTQEPEQDLVFEAFNKLSLEKIGVTVNFMMLDAGSYEQKMQMTIASGEKFDLCWTSNWRLNYNQNVAKGAFQPIDDQLKTNGQDIIKIIPENFLNATKVNGKIYGIPNFQVSTRQSGFYVRSDMAKKYNFDISKITKPEEMEPYLAAVKNEPGVHPMEFVASKAQPWAPLLIYYDMDELTGRNIPGVIKMHNSDMKVENQFKSPEFKQFITLINDWNNKGYISEDAITIKDDLPNKKAGKAMSGIVGNATPDTKSVQLNSANMEVDFVSLTEPVLTTSSILSTLTSVSQTCDNPDRAVSLINLMASDKDAINMLAFGIEGRHYTLVDGRPVIPDGSLYKNMNAFGWIYGNVFNMYLKPGEFQQEKDAIYKGNLEAYASPAAGFSFDAAPVKSEIAQCSSVSAEMLTTLCAGFSENLEEDLAKFLTKLDGAGAQKIIDEAQKQLDQWKKAQ